MQINLHKSKVPSVQLNNRLEEIVFITEPCTFQGIVQGINTKNALVLAGKHPHRVRAALRLHQDLFPWLVEEFTDEDMCTAAVNIEGKLVYVCSLYLDINYEARKPLTLKLIDWCESKKIPLVIGADCNAHSVLWGCNESNPRGEALEDLFLTKNLTVMNVGHNSTFSRLGAESIIDITVMNGVSLEKLNLTDWEVLTESSLSDHRYVKYCLGQYTPKEKMYRNLHRADWDIFQLHLNQCELPLIKEDGSNLDECALALEMLISEGLNVSCPMRKAVNRPPNPWWNTELDVIRKELVALQSKSSMSRSEEDWNAYRSMRKLYGSKIRKAKRDTWQKFCSDAETVKDISKIMKVLRPKPKQGISLFQNQDQVLSPTNTLGSLMDTHFLESTDADDDEEEEAVAVKHNDKETEKVVDYISPLRVIKSLETFGPMKAAGPDGIKPLVLQKLTVQLYIYISKLYRLAVMTGYAPKVWRMMKVVFLPKEGKKDYGQAKSYRPITLSNFLLKGLERIIQWYINDFIITKPLFAQHAYTVGRSCDTAVSEVVDFIESNILRKRHVLAVSLDCSGAFDRIKFPSAKEAMERMQIPASIIDLYGNILRSRRVQAQLQGEKMTRIPKRGSPQGGVLSPLIWNLIMDTILNTFQGDAVRVVGYADDILLMIGGPDPGSLVDIMNMALEKVLNWGDMNGLIFNPDKTSVVRFTNSKKFSTWREVRMKNKALEYETNMKYLGVVLESRLNWRPHAYQRVSKGIKTMNLAHAAIGQKWGFNPERALWTYTAMARSVATYGAIVWSPYATKTIKDRLNALQRRVISNMSSCMRSTPTAGAEVIIGLMPLDLHAHELGTNARLRTRNTTVNKWDGLGINKRNGHRYEHDKILEKICPQGYPLDVITRTRDWNQNDEVENPDLTIYTDGSKIGEQTGSGWAACRGDTVLAEDSYHLGTEASVFQAEVIAIDHALRWVTENCENGTEVLIRSDSQSAINALFKTTTCSKVVMACKGILRTAKENHRIAIEWIKGHADHTGNELADMLAKKASHMKVDVAGPHIPVPLAGIKKKLKEYFVKEWQKRWNANEVCRTSKLIFPCVAGSKLKKTSKLSKSNLNLLIQAGTGHALVGHHVGKWIEDITDECELCLEGPESTDHLFFECPALERNRREILAEGQDNIVKVILKFFSLENVKEIFALKGRRCQQRQLQL